MVLKATPRSPSWCYLVLDCSGSHSTEDQFNHYRIKETNTWQTLVVVTRTLKTVIEKEQDAQHNSHQRHTPVVGVDPLGVLLLRGIAGGPGLL